MKEILCESEVAQLLDCEPSTVLEKARRNELPGIKFGRSWRFPSAALFEVLNRKALENTASKPTARSMQPAKKTAKLPPALPKL